MIIGVPKEIKDHEARVGVTPAGVKALTRSRPQGAGRNRRRRRFPVSPTHDTRMPARRSWATPATYGAKPTWWSRSRSRSRRSMPTSATAWSCSPICTLRPSPVSPNKLLDRKVIGIAYETVRDRQNTLPLLTPMSEVAGTHERAGGRQLPRKGEGRPRHPAGRRPGRAACARYGDWRRGSGHQRGAVSRSGMGAKVTLIDLNLNRLREIDDIFNGRVYTLASNSYNVGHATREADLVIGGVLIPGATAPKIVTREMVSRMKKGAVIVDVAIDQGGCVETARPTSHSDPSYRRRRSGALLRHQHAGRGAAHLHAGADQCNVPLCAAHRESWARAKRSGRIPGLAEGLNTWQGTLTHRGVAESQHREWIAPAEVLGVTRSGAVWPARRFRLDRSIIAACL